MSLCWHTFVDDPARDLGIAKLVHIGQPPELGDLVQPDAPELPTAKIQEVSIAIPFVGIDTDDTDNAYTDGTEDRRRACVRQHRAHPGRFRSAGNLRDARLHPNSGRPRPAGDDATFCRCATCSRPMDERGTFTVHLDT